MKIKKREGVNYHKSGKRIGEAAEAQKDIFKLVFDGLINGKSRPEIKDEIVNTFGITRRSATTYVQKAYKKKIELDDNELSNLRFLQLARVEKLYSEALAKKSVKDALNAIDIINKLFGLYETKQKIEITKDVIQFKFDNFNENSNNVTDVSAEEIIEVEDGE